MERLKEMKEQLTSIVCSQLSDISKVDTKELGEAVDMIKDLAEAIYYCTITEAMHESESGLRSYGRVYPYYKDMDREYNGMYYPGDWSDHYNDIDSNKHLKKYDKGWEVYPIELSDYKDGISHKSRRMYMESKEMHKDKIEQMKELEQYMKELSQDITDMIEDAEPDQKQMLREKLTTLIGKIK